MSVHNTCHVNVVGCWLFLSVYLYQSITVYSASCTLSNFMISFITVSDYRMTRKGFPDERVRRVIIHN